MSVLSPCQALQGTYCLLIYQAHIYRIVAQITEPVGMPTLLTDSAVLQQVAHAKDRVQSSQSGSSTTICAFSVALKFCGIVQVSFISNADLLQRLMTFSNPRATISTCVNSASHLWNWSTSGHVLQELGKPYQSPSIWKACSWPSTCMGNG